MSGSVASDETVFMYAYVDPDDVFPEGAGAGDEFTNSNNGFAVEGTFVDVP